MNMGIKEAGFSVCLFCCKSIRTGAACGRPCTDKGNFIPCIIKMLRGDAHDGQNFQDPHE